MHYHLEIVMPPTNDIEGQINKIMLPFSENCEDEEDRNAHAFWDFYVIGGRWAGAKLQSTLDKDKLDQFYEELSNRKITVSSLTAGKQSLEPTSQIPMVDKLWTEFFPDSGISVCPLFAHSNDQYDSGSTIAGDICKVSEIPDTLKCRRLIIAKHHWKDEDSFEAGEMFQTSIWNGVTHQETTFDGLVVNAIKNQTERYTYYRTEWVEKNSVTPDWICVTVDYHS